MTDTLPDTLPHTVPETAPETAPDVSQATPPSDLPAEGIAPCPRCSSEDTKFCYYNNYNIKQPRYFCKVGGGQPGQPGMPGVGAEGHEWAPAGI